MADSAREQDHHNFLLLMAYMQLRMGISVGDERFCLKGPGRVQTKVERGLCCKSCIYREQHQVFSGSATLRYYLPKDILNKTYPELGLICDTDTDGTKPATEANNKSKNVWHLQSTYSSRCRDLRLLLQETQRLISEPGKSLAVLLTKFVAFSAGLLPFAHFV